MIPQPAAVENPFYLSYPDWALYGMVALATAATVIASQATISGAFSLPQQAIQLGYLPRMTILHTSSKTKGKIHIPNSERWRDRVFSAMARNAGSVTDFFNIPSNRVVELGTRVEL